MNFLAINLIATCNIRHLNNKCLNVIGIGSIKNLNTDSNFCTFFGECSSNKVDSNLSGVSVFLANSLANPNKTFKKNEKKNLLTLTQDVSEGGP